MDDVTTLSSGVPIDLDSDPGRRLVCDCVRAGEGLLSDAELQRKYISPLDFQAIAKDSALIKAIQAERERRVLSGVAVREMAAKHLIKGPSILDGIMSGADSSPKNKIEAFRELRSAAAVGHSSDRAADTEKFIIHIDLGDHAIHHEFDQPIKIDVSAEDSPNNLIPLKGKYDDDDRW